jgi:hypothetical protein
LLIGLRAVLYKLRFLCYIKAKLRENPGMPVVLVFVPHNHLYQELDSVQRHFVCIIFVEN